MLRKRKYLCKEAGHSKHGKPSILDLLEFECLHESMQVSSFEGPVLALKSITCHDICPKSHKGACRLHELLSCQGPQAGTIYCTACHPNNTEGHVSI